MSEDPEPETDAAPKPSRRGRWLFWFRVLWVLTLSPLVFAVVAAVMLMDRDISAPTWIVNLVEERAAQVLGGGALEFGAVDLHVGWDLHPTVRLRDVALRDADGTLITQVPQAEGLMSPRGLIFRREVLMQQIRLQGAQIDLRRARDGSVAVSFGAGGRNAGEAPSLVALLEQFDNALEEGPLEALETVDIAGVVVNFDDARAGRSWVVDGGELSLDLRDDQTLLRGNFTLLSGRAEVTTASLSYTSPRGSRTATLGLNIDNAIAADIAAQSPALRWLTNVDAPLSAALRTSLDVNGALGPLNATLEIGKGALRPNQATEPVLFDAAKTYLTYDPARDRIRFNEIDVQTEWGSVKGSGDAYLREFVDDLPRALLAQIQLRDIRLNPAGLYTDFLEVDGAVADVRLRFAPFALEIGQVVVNDGAARLMGAGEVAATDAGWQVALDTNVDEMSPQQMLSYWPEGFRPGTRRWFAENLQAGRLVDGHGGLRIGPDVPVRFAGHFGFDAARIQFMRTMPAITDATGTGFLADNALTIALDRGKMAGPQGGDLTLDGSVFTIPTLGIRDPPATIDLAVESSVTAILSVLNRPPFTLMDRANMPETLVDGRATVSGRMAMPLKPRIPREELIYDFRADVTRARSTAIVPERVLTASAVTVAVDPEELNISGPVRVDGLPMEIDWSRMMTPGSSGSTLQARTQVSPDFLETFGIALPPGTVTGRAPADLAVRLSPNGPPTFTLRSDLRGARVNIPPLGWTKAADSAGTLLVEGTLGPVPRVSNLALDAAGLRARGVVELDTDLQLATARFSQLQVGDWFNAPITLRGRGRGVPVGVEIGGGTVDLRRARFGGGQGQGGPVTIALDRLQVTEGIALTGFRGEFSNASGFTGNFSARINGATALRGSVAPRNGRSAVRLVSDDAGGVARAAGFMRNGVGGTLDLTLLPTGGAGTFDGFLAIRGIRVRDAPTMAALLDAISVVGLLQQLDGQGLAFDEVDARFRLTPQQMIITEASAVGPGLGISVDGLYTLASKQLDLQGVVSPFYLVNSIGSFLTRRGEGLIGFNFNIAGTADRPQVNVNPLSAFTPGMFREIFRRPPPVVTQ
ncbi:YhdP family protein [Yoonia sp. 2307UL14-13]|uniref:YhdP family protein n=1 Tax=Yoonia sp. 2307UL14-13 TaxID=3126506 RepID=UPI0030A85B04